MNQIEYKGMGESEIKSKVLEKYGESSIKKIQYYIEKKDLVSLYYYLSVLNLK